LHVLSTPPAFILSQDQTLRKKITNTTLKQVGKTRSSINSITGKPSSQSHGGALPTATNLC
jgi:hypothetical protein